MKKVYALVFLLALMSPETYGKTTGLSVPSLFPQFGPGGTSQHQSFYQSRIIGQSYYVHDGTNFIPMDSTTYAYSFGRGGELSKEEMDDHYVSFDVSYTYRYDVSTSSWVNRYERSQTYNATNKAEYYTCRNWKTSTSSWKDSARFVYIYNSDQTRLDSTSFQIAMNFGWQHHVFYRNIYDPITNKLTAINSLVYRWSFEYDPSGNMIKREEKKYSFPLGGWTNSARHTFTYDLNNRITTYIVESFNNGWENEEKFEYTYSGNEVISSLCYKWDGAGWELTGKHEFTYDNNRNKLSDTWIEWDAATSTWTNVSVLLWTYNQFGQPTTYQSKTWDGTNWVVASEDFLRSFYYQSYNPNSVNSVANKTEVQVYPQPASSALNIKLSDAIATTGEINIIDMQGRVVQKNAMQPGKEQAISVAGLPTGTYVLRFKSGEINHSRQISVVH